MLPCVCIYTNLIGQHQPFGVFNLPDCSAAFVVDSFIPSIFYVLSEPLTQPPFPTGFSNV